MLAIEWVVLVSAVTAVIGGVIGLFVGRRSGADKDRISQLETAVADKEDELIKYRAQVFNEFAETAEKFRSLDQSYHALHRQLATSSASLLGDQATPLLTQSAVVEVDDSTADTQVDVIQESAEGGDGETIEENAEETVGESVGESELNLDEIVVDETVVDVPTLTEPLESGVDLALDNETSASRRD